MYYMAILRNNKNYEQCVIFFYINILEEKNHKKLIRIYSAIHELTNFNISCIAIFKVLDIEYAKKHNINNYNNKETIVIDYKELIKLLEFLYVQS